MLPECPRCHIAAESSQARFCARCGGEIIPSAYKPIMIEKPRSLLSPSFGIGLAIVLGGTALATRGSLRLSAIVLCSGVLILLFVVSRSQRH